MTMERMMKLFSLYSKKCGSEYEENGVNSIVEQSLFQEYHVRSLFGDGSSSVYLIEQMKLKI